MDGETGEVDGWEGGERRARAQPTILATSTCRKPAAVAKWLQTAVEKKKMMKTTGSCCVCRIDRNRRPLFISQWGNLLNYCNGVVQKRWQIVCKCRNVTGSSGQPTAAESLENLCRGQRLALQRECDRPVTLQSPLFGSFLLVM